MWTHSPHFPVVSSKKYKDLYKGFTNKQQLYYGCISALDGQIGRLWKELETLGIADNTIIWFCSDNGPEVSTPGSQGDFRITSYNVCYTKLLREDVVVHCHSLTADDLRSASLAETKNAFFASLRGGRVIPKGKTNRETE